MRWEYLREEEFESAIERSNGVCAMAVGCLEKHGQHLPVGTDTLKGDMILRMAAEIEEVCVFPASFVGNVMGYHSIKNLDERNWRGGVGLSPELLMRYLQEMCGEIARNGFKKILLFNSHGGNRAFLDFFAQSVGYEKKDYVVMTAYNKLIHPKEVLEVLKEKGRAYLPMLTDEDIKVLEHYAEHGTGGGHADFMETALMQGTYPELVNLDRIHAESGLSKQRVALSESGVFCPGEWSANFPNSYEGYAPEGCSRTIGDACVKIAVERTAGILKTLKEEPFLDELLREKRNAK